MEKTSNVSGISREKRQICRKILVFFGIFDYNLPYEAKIIKSLQIFANKYQPDYRVIMSANPLVIDNTHGLHRYPLYLAEKFPYPSTFKIDL